MVSPWKPADISFCVFAYDHEDIYQNSSTDEMLQIPGQVSGGSREYKKRGTEEVIIPGTAHMLPMESQMSLTRKYLLF